MCEKECPGNQEWNECFCPNDVMCWSDLDECENSCVGGCSCPIGLFKNEDGKCVKRNECSCLFENEIIPAGNTLEDEYRSCRCSNGNMNCYSKSNSNYTCENGLV